MYSREMLGPRELIGGGVAVVLVAGGAGYAWGNSGSESGSLENVSTADEPSVEETTTTLEPPGSSTTIEMDNGEGVISLPGVLIEVVPGEQALVEAGADGVRIRVPSLDMGNAEFVDGKFVCETEGGDTSVESESTEAAEAEVEGAEPEDEGANEEMGEDEGGGEDEGEEAEEGNEPEDEGVNEEASEDEGVIVTAEVCDVSHIFGQLEGLLPVELDSVVEETLKAAA